MTSSELSQTELLKEQQARSELEMFYLLSVAEGVLILSQCQSSGTQTSSESTEKLEREAQQLGGRAKA